MLISKRYFLAFIAFSSVTSAHAQFTDSLPGKPGIGNSISPVKKWNLPNNKKPVQRCSFIVPVILMVYGIASLKRDGLKSFNKKIKEEL